MNQDPRPTFRQLCAQHRVYIEEIIGSLPGIPYEEIVRVDSEGIGLPHVIDAMLAELSERTGIRYTRENVGQLSFLPASREL
ncbi:MAG TPA: hypothetical protein VKR06_44380 [Ktedonosporobacter sp.]|nr:hypothetical protein [Ktedonosporobacter sp.]